MANPTRQQGKSWCWTLNNWTQEEYDSLCAAASSCTYLVFGKETCPTTSTPHLQGFVIFSSNKRFNAAKSFLGNRVHLQIRSPRSTNEQAAEYCKKDGDYEEFGQLPANTQGKRGDWERLVAWIAEQEDRPTAFDLIQNFPSLYGRYSRSVWHYVDVLFEQPPMVDGALRPWQQQLSEKLLEEPDDRKIIFVVDPIGGFGKSWFIKHWIGLHPHDTQRLSIGKRDDIAFAIDSFRKYFLFDIPRSQSEYLQYSVLEQLKDRMIFSAKYESTNKILSNIPHVVVFMNEEPDYNKLTNDRYELFRPY